MTIKNSLSILTALSLLVPHTACTREAAYTSRKFRARRYSKNYLPGDEIKRKKKKKRVTLLLAGAVLLTSVLLEDPNPFDEVQLGVREQEWSDSLGPLQQVSLQHCQINKDLLRCKIFSKSDVSEYPTSFNRAQTQLIDLAQRVNFPGSQRFEGYANPAAFIRSLGSFADAMNRKLFVDGITAKKLNYVIAKMHALDVGRSDQQDGDLQPEQLNNRSEMRLLLQEMPILMHQCHTVTDAFLEHSVGKLGLGITQSVTFPIRVYFYVKEQYLRDQLEEGIPAFLIKKRSEHPECNSLRQAQDEFRSLAHRQHLVNGFKRIVKNHLSYSGQESIREEFASTIHIFRFTGYYLFYHNLVKEFLRFFLDEYLTPRAVLDHFKQVIINPRNPNLTCEEYVKFAKEKGLKEEEMYKDLSCEELDEDKLLQILFNIKLFVPAGN